MKNNTSETYKLFNLVIESIRNEYDQNYRSGIASFLIKMYDQDNNEMREYSNKDGEKIIFSLPFLLEILNHYMTVNSSFFYSLTDLDQDGTQILITELNQNKSNKNDIKAVVKK